MPLAVLKPEAPIPFGIKVDQIQHSEYGGSVDDDRTKAHDDLKEEDEGSVSSGLELAPLKKEEVVPVGIKVDQIQHSDFGG